MQLVCKWSWVQILPLNEVTQGKALTFCCAVLVSEQWVTTLNLMDGGGCRILNREIKMHSSNWVPDTQSLVCITGTVVQKSKELLHLTSAF